MTGSVQTSTPAPVVRLVVPALVALSLVPVIHVLTRAFLASRNVAYWDELDTALALLLRLDRSAWTDVLGQLGSLSNEHRTFTSRLLFAGSYWFTGTVNFTVIGVIGNLFICGLCALLVATAGTTERRVRMSVLLAALIFQLEHYENFLWSGASIDHFQVVLLAGAAFVALARGTRLALLSALLLGLLAAFTLAHGLMVWPVGALALAADRRWRQLGLWLGFAALVGALFFQGFGFNASHHIGDFSAAGLSRILRYWLGLLGAPLALGELSVAPFLGIGLLALLGHLLTRPALGRERIALPLAFWAVAALLLVAVGRADLTGGQIYSRYYVLGSLAWALVLFMHIEFWRDAARPYWLLVRVVPLLVVFNITANAFFASDAQSWITCRDSAADFYVHNGRDGVGRYTLHPNPDYATWLIQQVEQAGVYRMPRLCREKRFPHARPAEKLVFSVDRIGVQKKMVEITGWAGLSGLESRPGQVHVILQSSNSRFVFTTLPMERPDVAAAHGTESWRSAGFRFQRRPWLLPQENYRIGLLIESERGAEFVMTAHRLDLSAKAEVVADVVHPNGNRYDRVLLKQATATFTAPPRGITRVSFIDLTDAIVHVEFSGAGTLALKLDESSGPAAPRNYNQPTISYLKGHASLTISGADETTNVSVFSVGNGKVSGPARLKDQETHGGLAHVALISIASRNGKFGGLRTANVHYCATKGLTGVHAPGIRFNGPVFVGDISAFDSATPVLELGSAGDTRINGGSLYQANGRPVRVSGVTRLNFVDGSTASGERLQAQRSRGVLLQDGVDVSAQIVVERAE